MSDEVTPSSTHSLGPKIVGDIRGSFWVPRYQRGYRWDSHDVTRLLDDIWNCNGAPYNLQPVVVKLNTAGADPQSHEWELIDGQQRLTTLYLILHYMKAKGWKKLGAPYRIRYETRPASGEYLDTLDPTLSSENIDFFHIFKAYDCIDAWFQKHGDEHVQESVVSTFYVYLTKCVRVIWYQTAKENPTALFTRLNVGRISLTDAELVKAQLLSKVRKESKERAPEIAAQWDAIERDLHDPDVWAFLTGLDDSDHLERYPTRISLLLDTLADGKAGSALPKGKRPRYFTFDQLHDDIDGDPLAFWTEVVDLHATLLGWFSEPALYNKIGFLVAAGWQFGRIVTLAKDRRKSEFDCLLIYRIRDEVIRLPKSQLLDLSYDRVADQRRLLRLLLMMNVETASRTGARFPFRRHVGKVWSLEHIHAQHAEPLQEAKAWATWLREHRKALQAVGGQQVLIEKVDEALNNLGASAAFGDTFQQLARQIISVFNAPGTAGSDHTLHAISNLALLSSGDNSALSNAVFEVKRQRVLEIDRNEAQRADAYIPICTRNVFLKYYTGADAQQVHFWSPQDRASYFEAIVAALEVYLQDDNEEEAA